MPYGDIGLAWRRLYRMDKYLRVRKARILKFLFENILFTKFFLQLDNGFGYLRGTGLTVEYDISYRK